VIRRCLLVGVVVLTVLGIGTVAAAEPATHPRLRLVAGVGPGPVTLERPAGAWVWLELGTYVVAGREAFEVRARRAGYDQPVVARQVVGSGPSRRAVRLPAGLVGDLTGFPAFTHVRVTDPSGATVAEQDEPFCPAGAPSGAPRGGAVQVDADAPGSSPYPQGCPTHPFALGAVWGLQAGWGAPSTSPWYSGPVDLPDGAYTAVVQVNQPYRDLFAIPAGQATATVAFSVRTTPGAAAARPGGPLPGHAADGQAGPAGQAARPGAGGNPGAAPPATPAQAAGRRGGRYLPDLRPLPAWAIWLDSGPDGDLLTFAATVWNAGTSPLAVRGTRREGTQLMDAEQSFSDPAGHPTATAPAGTFEWDPREGHQHWHFSDFAAYRLLDPDGAVVVPSHKQAFCLANTDPVDTTIPTAAWQPPYGFDPGCGRADAQTLQQRLDVGWGDTYLQYLPGQAIDVTSVPNGTYQLEITANPNGRLHEATTRNNAARRQVVLGGDPGARFAVVPPYQGIDA